MTDLQTLLDASAARHCHLCPRQVLGVRAALFGSSLLKLEVPRDDKRLLVIVETDGCFTDGIEVVTHSTIGRRTLRVEDFGKIAATFIDVKTENAIRVAPRLNIRQRAYHYVTGEKHHYNAQLNAYQLMPVNELFFVQNVALMTPIEAIVSHAGLRTECDECGEDIINEREIFSAGRILCRACAGFSYYAVKLGEAEYLSGNVVDKHIV